mmetsp:Transcript_47858/g.79394  ORF Transcript_47858/g.79394 Transcript_47858/m.79394 type:complete len:297 (+) Transcript_47858:373-1263(+)
MKLIVKHTAPNTFTASRITFRVASLNHKTANHAMKNDIVVVAIQAVHTEILHRLWTFDGKQFQINIAKRGPNNGVRTQRTMCGVRRNLGMHSRRFLILNIAMLIRLVIGAIRKHIKTIFLICAHKHAWIFCCRCCLFHHGRGRRCQDGVGTKALRMRLSKISVCDTLKQAQVQKAHIGLLGANHAQQCAIACIQHFDAHHGGVQHTSIVCIKHDIATQPTMLIAHECLCHLFLELSLDCDMLTKLNGVFMIQSFIVALILRNAFVDGKTHSTARKLKHAHKIIAGCDSDQFMRRTQ